MDYDRARTACASLGGHLPMPKTEEANLRLLEYINRNNLTQKLFSLCDGGAESCHNPGKLPGLSGGTNRNQARLAAARASFQRLTCY